METNLPHNLFRQTIYPVFFVLAAKFGSVFLLAGALKIEYRPTAFGLIFSSYGDFFKVNSYSALAVLAVVTAGLLWSLIRANYFHASHLSPLLSRRLMAFGVISLVKPSLPLYTHAAVWLALAWLTAGDFIFESYLGLLAPWLFWLSLTVALIFTWALLSDFEKEIDSEEVVTEISVQTIDENF